MQGQLPPPPPPRCPHVTPQDKILYTYHYGYVILKLCLLQVDTARVVWSYHSQDPANEDELATLQHERMGASSLNFLGGLSEERVEEDTQSFALLSDNVSVHFARLNILPPWDSLGHRNDC